MTMHKCESKKCKGEDKPIVLFKDSYGWNTKFTKFCLTCSCIHILVCNNCGDYNKDTEFFCEYECLKSYIENNYKPTKTKKIT